jgi:uncharacterized UPF0160 family protein
MFPFMKQSLSAILNPIRSIPIVASVPPNVLNANRVILGTHDGTFHCDEALALGLLLMLPDHGINAMICRSRNPNELSQCKVVVDVGAVYEPENYRFDHHQRGFDQVLEGYNTKLSSAGLIYKHFGRDVIRAVLTGIQSTAAQDETFVEACYQRIYKDFIEHIDAFDNGIEVADGALRYHISTTLSNRVGWLNPSWNEAVSVETINDNLFREAMLLTSSEFLYHVYDLSSSWLPARSIVQDAIDRRFEHDSLGRILVLSQHCPWKDHIFDLEAKANVNQILYILYQDSAGSWRIQAVPLDPNSFSSRKALPEAWRGLRDQALSEKAGIDGCIFIHASGFIGGHATKEGAIWLAKKALEMN